MEILWCLSLQLETNSYSHDEWITIILGHLLSRFPLLITSGNHSIEWENGFYGYSVRILQGILVYMNEIEVYWDNISEGLIGYTTLITHSYDDDYRWIILSVVFGEMSESVITVELHFTVTAERTLEFNCFIPVHLESLKLILVLSTFYLGFWFVYLSFSVLLSFFSILWTIVIHHS